MAQGRCDVANEWTDPTGNEMVIAGRGTALVASRSLRGPSARKPLLPQGAVV